MRTSYSTWLAPGGGGSGIRADVLRQQAKLQAVLLVAVFSLGAGSKA